MRRLLLTLAALVALVSPARAHTIHEVATFQEGVNGFTGWADTRLAASTANRNWGAFATVAVGNTGGANEIIGLLYVPISAALDELPADAVIDTVQIILASSNSSNADSIRYDHVIVEGIVEGAGSGGAADTLGATYNCWNQLEAASTSNPWGLASADSVGPFPTGLAVIGDTPLMSWPAFLDSVYTGSDAIAADRVPGACAFLVYGNLTSGVTTTTDLTAFGKDYDAGRITADPWLRMERTSGSTTNNYTFHSSEATTASLRPILRIVYHVPRPGGSMGEGEGMGG
jgi:hypothetical protein